MKWGFSFRGSWTVKCGGGTSERVFELEVSSSSSSSSRRRKIDRGRIMAQGSKDNIEGKGV